MNKIQIDELFAQSRSKQLAFAYLACERVYKNCLFFAEKFSLDFSLMKTGIETLKDFIFQEDANSEQGIDFLIDNIFKIIPNTDEFTDSNATIAMYCGGVIHESLRLCREYSNIVLKGISSLIIDAVDCFIQERDDMDYEDEEFEEKINNDPLMIQEIAWQNHIIRLLVNTLNFDKNQLEDLIISQEGKELNLKLPSSF